MGRPKGSKNDRLWQDAVRKAALEREPKSREQYITIAARATVMAAASGDQQAAKEMGDRLDGRPRQQTEHSGPAGGAIPHVITWKSAE